MRTIVFSTLVVLALAAPAFAQPLTEVMIVGTYHMSNPGRDMHDVRADDVLAPKRQAEIEAVVGGLAAFRPTVVDVEWDNATVAERWTKYISGTLPASHNEVVQLGFRLAKVAHAASVNGIDVEGDFPFDPVQAFATAHGEAPLLKAADDAIVAEIADVNGILAKGSIADALRFFNDPAHIANDNAFYRTTLKIGSGANQPGADLLTAWYKRNFYICANLIQHARPGDHVVVIYGSGHAFLLRQCVSETPGFKLVDTNAFLPG
jgi:hypothetical protein